ncbi:MAG: septum formation initiator family protein [Bacteroidales bacterium]|nr:septum formation initiator family protein [Bacteroidales bacterium]
MKVFDFITRHKYLLTIAVFAIFLFFGNNRIAFNRELKQQIKEKEKVVAAERAKIDSVEMYIEQIQHDTLLQEEYIRNHYGMKKSNEDIFQISKPTEKGKR